MKEKQKRKLKLKRKVKNEISSNYILAVGLYTFKRSILYHFSVCLQEFQETMADYNAELQEQSDERARPISPVTLALVEGRSLINICATTV